MPPEEVNLPASKPLRVVTSVMPETAKLEPETIFSALSAAVKLPDRMILPPLPTNLFAVPLDRVIAGPTLAPLLSFSNALSVRTSAEFAPKTTLF